MTINGLNVDPDQGVNDRDEAYGFIDDPADDDLTGWFFTWPGRAQTEITQDEANAIVDTLELDETAPSSAQSVPYSAAVEALQKYLDQYTESK